jgi:hypothetical protein
MSRLWLASFVHDGLVAGIDASNPFFVSEFNSQLFFKLMS